MSKRIAYIDIAKGIGILLVVLAHNDLSAYHPVLHRFIYAFHIPLFFFLSGIFFKPTHPIKEIAVRRFNALIKPLIFILGLIYGISVFFGKMSIATAASRLLKSLYLTGPYLNWLPLWFLPALFVITLYAALYYRVSQKLPANWMRWLLLMLTLWIGTLILPHTWTLDIEILGRSLSFYGLPANLDLVLVGGFYFILAYESYRQLPDQIFTSKISLLLSAILLIGMVLKFNIYTDLAARFYPSWILSTLQAIAGIVFILSLSRQIELISPQATRLFSYIGKLTLPILIFHLPIQEMTNNKLSVYLGQNDLTLVLAFLVSVSMSIFIHEFFIAPNPKVRAWFGQS